MENRNNVSRRSFLRNSSLGFGAGIIGTAPIIQTSAPASTQKRLQREICVASIDLKELWPDSTRASRLKRVLARMDDLAGIRPDIICLPELFDSMWVAEKKPLSEIAQPEDMMGEVSAKVAEYARKNNCYVVCPVITKANGHFYNSSLLLDRKGKIAGVYHKTHPVKSEMLPDRDYKGGVVTPGAINQPIIKTDFGRIGMQICYDANWSDGWDNLQKQGAEVILFSSAFPGGRMLNYYAQRNNCYIISSTGGDARIIDMSGNDLDASSTFVRYAWATVNLEKVNVTTWPTRDRLPAIFKKYGNRLAIKVWDATGLITIESRDPDIKVLDVLKEFNIPRYQELIKNETIIQDKHRLRVAGT